MFFDTGRAALLAWAFHSWQRFTVMNKKTMLFGHHLAGEDRRYLASYFLLVSVGIFRLTLRSWWKRPITTSIYSYFLAGSLKEFLKRVWCLTVWALLIRVWEELFFARVLWLRNSRLKRIQLLGQPLSSHAGPNPEIPIDLDPRSREGGLACSICHHTYNYTEEVLHNFCKRVKSHVCHPSCLLPWWYAIGPMRVVCPECLGPMRVRVKLSSTSLNPYPLSEIWQEWAKQSRTKEISRRTAQFLQWLLFTEALNGWEKRTNSISM